MMFFSLLSGPPSGKDAANPLFNNNLAESICYARKIKKPSSWTIRSMCFKVIHTFMILSLKDHNFFFKLTASNAPFSHYTTTYSGLTYPYWCELMRIMMWHIRQISPRNVIVFARRSRISTDTDVWLINQCSRVLSEKRLTPPVDRDSSRSYGSFIYVVSHPCFSFSVSHLWSDLPPAAGVSLPGTGRRSPDRATCSMTQSVTKKSLTEGMDSLTSTSKLAPWPRNLGNDVKSTTWWTAISHRKM